MNRKAGDQTAPILAGKRPIRSDPVVIAGVDQDRTRIGSAVLGRRGAGWRPRRSPAGAEGRGPTTHARQWGDDEVRADPSDCAEAIPDRRARRRTRGEDDARPDGGVSRRWRANRNPSLRQLLAAFPPRVGRPQPQDPGRRCRFPRGTPLVSSRGCGCASASIKGSRPLIPRSSPTAGEQCGASAPAAAAVDQTRGEAHGCLRQNETLLRGN